MANDELDQHVLAIMEDHHEALVVYADRSSDGESILKLLFKFDEQDSRLSRYLEELLSRLQSILHAKRRRLTSDAATGT